MIRTALILNLAVAAILCGLFVVLLFTIPARAAQQKCGVVASWYGSESCISHPCRTASGSAFTGRDLTAAMPSRSHLGERWRVTYRGRSVVVLVDDTGGFARLGRAIDLSKAAFARIAPLGQGTVKVCIERVG